MQCHSWLRHCASCWNVTGSIPNGVTSIFHSLNPSSCTIALGLTQSLPDMSTRNIFWGVKAAGAKGWQPCNLHMLTILKSGSLNLLEPLGLLKACTVINIPLLILNVWVLRLLHQCCWMFSLLQCYAVTFVIIVSSFSGSARLWNISNFTSQCSITSYKTWVCNLKCLSVPVEIRNNRLKQIRLKEIACVHVHTLACMCMWICMQNETTITGVPPSCKCMWVNIMIINRRISFHFVIIP